MRSKGQQIHNRRAGADQAPVKTGH
jgi:hypothetical protein